MIIRAFTEDVAKICKTAARTYKRRTGCTLWTLDDLEQQAYLIALEMLQDGKRYTPGGFFQCLQFRLIDAYRAETKCRRKRGNAPPTVVLFPWDNIERIEDANTNDYCIKDSRGDLVDYNEKVFKSVCRRELTKSDKTTRAIFEQRYKAGKTFKEISARVGLSESTTSERARKICERIKRAYFREMWKRQRC